MARQKTHEEKVAERRLRKRFAALPEYLWLEYGDAVSTRGEAGGAGYERFRCQRPEVDYDACGEPVAESSTDLFLLDAPMSPEEFRVSVVLSEFGDGREVYEGLYAWLHVAEATRMDGDGKCAAYEVSYTEPLD